MFTQWEYGFRYSLSSKDIGELIVVKDKQHIKKQEREKIDYYIQLEEDDVKKSIFLKDVCRNAEPIARSQARRLLLGLEKFKQVEFDFSEIDFMGQGFADEVFRVFKEHHPEVEIIPVNACPRVLGMIKHVQRA